MDYLSEKRTSLKSHSIIALNLQTVEDVKQVIRQCEALRGQMQGGSDGIKITDGDISIAKSYTFDNTKIEK